MRLDERRRLHPQRCESAGHPGWTFNPWHNRTWCLCGAVVRNGDQVDLASRNINQLEEIVPCSSS
jgi:hypothetical protein